MADMFKRNIGYAGTIKPENAFFSSNDGLGNGLVTSVGLVYEQALTRTWSLFGNGGSAAGGARVWLVAGDTQGSLKLGALYGAGKVGGTGSLCAPGTCSLVAHGATSCGNATGLADAAPETLTMNDCVVTSYGFSGSAGANMSIQQDVSVTFISMDNGAAA